MAKNFVGIADFNNNFSGSSDPINVMDSDLGKKTVRITDSKQNCSRTADLSMAASTDLALKLRGSLGTVPPFIPSDCMLLADPVNVFPYQIQLKSIHIQGNNIFQTHFSFHV